MRAAVLGVMLLCFSGSAAVAASPACRLTPADKAANAALSFDDFDQKGVTPSTWRALTEKSHCYDLAVEAAEDYLVNGPALTPHQKSIVLFHIAQSLALGGDNARAALMVAADMPPDRAPDDGFDWPTYLRGTWAFLVKDKAALDGAIARLVSEPGDTNRINTKVLKGLAVCFDKPYAVADAPTACRPKA